MFDSYNNHLVHREAVDLTVENLPGAVSMDSVYGYDAPYHIEWQGLKLLVKVARPSRKLSQKRAKWFYALRKKDHKVNDFFILFCLLENNIKAVYAIPKILSPAVYITITKLDGNMRYDYFKTTIQDLPSKLTQLKENLPRLAKIYKEAKKLKRGET